MGKEKQSMHAMEIKILYDTCKRKDMAIEALSEIITILEKRIRHLKANGGHERRNKPR